MKHPKDGEVFRFREVVGDDNEDLDNWDNLTPDPVRTEAGLMASIARRKAANSDDPAIATLEQHLVSMRAGWSVSGSGDAGDDDSSNSATSKPTYFSVGSEPVKRPEVKGKYFTIPGE